MARKKIETIIKGKIYPYELSKKGKADISELSRKYEYDFLIECIDIGINKYVQYDNEEQVTQDSVNIFLQKLGGIAYNKSRTLIEQEVSHVRNICKNKYSYWDDYKANIILHDYIEALKHTGYNEGQIINDMQNEVKHLCNISRNWTQWSNEMKDWINDLYNCKENENVVIEQNGTILPTILFEDLSSNFKHLCEQINASYENNLYDCTAVMMRRLLEGLLVLSYQNHEIESEITAKDGKHHFALDKIMKNAENNQTLKLSADVKTDLFLFKNLGNYSAHKIWYICTRQDIESHILNYRVVIEELLYKSGVKK